MNPYILTGLICFLIGFIFGILAVLAYVMLHDGRAR